MKYKSIVATRAGSPEVLQIVENELRAPSKGEARIKVLAAAVSRPDITVRRGEALYSGTPLGQKFPFVPGYAIIGNVEAIGEEVGEVAVGDRVGALTVTGGYTECLYWRSDRLIPVPESVEPAEAVTLVLNYIVAYQSLHRSAKVKAGEKALIIGASGGIGTALLQLGRLAGLTMYGIASKSKHDVVTQYGATPIDYRTQDYLELIRRAEPEGLDVVIDGMMRLEYIKGGLSLLRRGGRMVSFGEPAGLGALARILATFVGTNLSPNGKAFKLYGTSSYFLSNRRPYLEDWVTLFRVLEERKIEPVIMQRFPILEAAKANELLESGAVTGNVVLVADGATGDAVLRDVMEEDLAVFFEQQLDPTANQMAAFTAKDPADQAAFDKHWAKILSDETIAKKTILLEGQVAGHVLGFKHFGVRSVSYWLGREYWGKGIATRALSLFLEQERTRPLFARAAKDNVASIRVLEKCGFKISGEDKGYANARGEEVEEYVLRLDASASED